METHGSSKTKSKRKREASSSKTSQSRSRSRRKSDDDDDSYDSETDSRGSLPPSHHRSHKRSLSRRSASRDSDHSDDGSDLERKRKRSSSKKVTDEDIADYLAKKAQKKALKVAKKLKSQTVSGYSNDANPFGDSNLNEKFVWRKKIEKDISHGVPLDMFSIKAEKKKQRERMAEIEKVKKRREERAIEKAQHEEEMALLARERARAEFQDWEKKEEEFHFDQSKVRSEIRLREGRTKPIDILSKQLNPLDDFDIEINEPYMVLKGLTVREMEELREDIKMHLDLDRATPTHIEYWEALLVVCDWELAEARKKDALDRARVRGEQPPAELLAEERGLHSSIETDVKNLLQGKSYGELEALQSQIESQMRSGTAKVVEYWEAVLKRLHIYKAKACLKEIHTKMLRKHLEHLEQPLEGEENLEPERSLSPIEEETDHDEKDAEALSPEPMPDEETHEVEEEAGSYSPQLLHDNENEEAIDPEEDRAILELKRKAVLEEQQRRIQEAMASRPAPPEDNLEIKAMKAMGAMEEGDAVFGTSDEINLDSQVYWWHDKYRPRKPKYFNRVHTGYEWNKYNQTHYDHDNPPPKIVQGYKFNIFYPDLVDKIKAPTYTIEKDGDSGETCIIRFHAGPPYEDIAFRIVNKEWEYSHKKGFKCTFERGILHVYFNFKRYRYRR
ncbi:Cactin [Camellia lanceoleosa]|uniref:Cactin n=1 Tax=Camellia lanceoleosa TaxID=1840588 RepID=A0ACC0GAG7_9ERIC|nr:Cactin [Camellia lanceoleosa]